MSYLKFAGLLITIVPSFVIWIVNAGVLAANVGREEKTHWLQWAILFIPIPIGIILMIFG